MIEFQGNYKYFIHHELGKLRTVWLSKMFGDQDYKRKMLLIHLTTNLKGKYI